MTNRDVVVEDCEFWMVWTKYGRVPRYIHDTEVSAHEEADRLARENKGKKFIVLRAYRKVRSVAAVETTVDTSVDTTAAVES